MVSRSSQISLLGAVLICMQSCAASTLMTVSKERIDAYKSSLACQSSLYFAGQVGAAGLGILACMYGASGKSLLALSGNMSGQSDHQSSLWMTILSKIGSLAAVSVTNMALGKYINFVVSPFGALTTRTYAEDIAHHMQKIETLVSLCALEPADVEAFKGLIRERTQETITLVEKLTALISTENDEEKKILCAQLIVRTNTLTCQVDPSLQTGSFHGLGLLFKKYLKELELFLTLIK